MTILFITRKYPPQVGGMENYSYGLISNISCRYKLIALTRSQIHLIWFLPYALIKGLWSAHGVDIIYLCDSLLAPLGFLLKIFTRKPVLTAAHGLDITFPMFFYQKLVVSFVKRLDGVVAVSHSTIKECVRRGVNREKCVFIPNGVAIPSLINEYSVGDVEKMFDLSLSNKKILLSVGRLIKRKGIEWFIREAIGHLPAEIIYLIAGDGPEIENIRQAIIEKELQGKVFLLGRVTDDEREALFQVADLFIMPNIIVPGDMEGFGIVTIEAAGRGLPVIASHIEGLSDAIVDGQNGFLVESQNVQAFTDKISGLIGQKDLKNIGDRIAAYTKKYYNWKYIGHLYIEEFKKHLKNASDHA